MEQFDIEQLYRSKVEKLGNPNLAGWAQGQCPLHEDRHNSFSVHLKTGSFKCFGGCSKGSVRDFAKHFNIELPKESWVVQSYRYQSPDGNTSYEKELLDNKKFRFKANIEGKTVYTLGNIPRSLYGLPLLLSSDKSKDIFIVEGEKCVDYLNAEGWNAVTPGGSSNWINEFAGYFKDRKVIVWGDNDEPGKKFLETVINSLKNNTQSLKAFIDETLPKGGDAEDWFLRGSDSESLSKLIHSLPEININIESISCIDLMQYAEKPIQWDIKDLIPSQSRVIFGSAPKTGKTFTALEMAISLASGEAFLNHFQIDKFKKVLFFEKEDSRELVAHRLKKLLSGKSIEAPEALHFIFDREIKIDQPKWDEAFKRKMDIIKPEVLFFDTFRRIHGADENASEELDVVLQKLDKIMIDYSCSAILIHHLNKSSSAMAPLDELLSLRGSSALAGWADAALIFRRGAGHEKTVNVILKHATPIENFTFEIKDIEKYGVQAIELAYKGQTKEIRKDRAGNQALDVLMKTYQDEGRDACTLSNLGKKLGWSYFKTFRTFDQLSKDSKLIKEEGQGTGKGFAKKASLYLPFAE